MKPIRLAVAQSETVPPSGGFSNPVSGGEGGEIYPTFTYRGPLDLDLPEDGEMTIHYRQIDERSAPRPSGERYYECTIQVRKILDVKEEKDEAPAKSYDEAGEALDKLMEEREAQ
jgi:hypothetical protein